jgi:hypothetical protein
MPEKVNLKKSQSEVSGIHSDRRSSSGSFAIFAAAARNNAGAERNRNNENPKH